MLENAPTAIDLLQQTSASQSAATPLAATSSAALPSGIILPYGGSGAPSSDWLICDGTAVSRTTYSNLFGVIGTAYGAGDGSTTFNLPDLRGRLPVGLSTGGPALINTLGKNDGVALNSRNISHHHTLSAGGNNTGGGDPGHSSTMSTSGDVNNTDYPAFQVVNYIVRI